MLKLIRFWVPVVLCTAGVLVIVVGSFSEHSLEVGIPVFSAGASIWLLNFLYRIGISGDKERDSEAEARAYYAEHGHWPGEHGTDAPRDGASR